MYFALTLPALVAVLSFLCVSTATDSIRVPLERKSIVTSLTPLVNTPLVDFLKSHLAFIELKYHTTLAAYLSNTGSPHPLALAISGQKDSGVGTALPRGKLEKRRRRTYNSNLDSSSHVPQGRHAEREDIPLSEVNANMWMGTISMGTPKRTFTVDFDTGSADLILPSNECNSSCNGHTRYDPTASSTSVNLNSTFQVAYGGGSTANGTQYADDVYMDGYEAVNQTFGAAKFYSSGMQIPTFVPDGLLGMAFSSMSVLSAPTVFQTMVSTGAVQQAVFGFLLSSESGKSELTIGGTNTALYQESTIEYVDVTVEAYWQVRFAGLTRPGLNNTAEVVVVNQTSYAEAIIDTGTTLIVTSDISAQAFYANVPGAAEIGGGLWTVPCDIVGSLAPTLTFGSRSFNISSSTFNVGPTYEGSTDCIAGLAGGGSTFQFWIIGDVFLQNVYTIFDLGNSRVGFADLA